ncbi:MAG: GTP 3',8-cyclase MoaA [Magnetococcales bacterium]|nr:GTP 3',8-cyclase MoaA [Magnetococcales bacterium]
MPLVDTFGRTIRYLRVSVTDRCNFRCHYCRPAEGIALAEQEEILSLEEMARLVRLFTELGVERVRLTGGEPLLRRNVMELIETLGALPGLEDLSLSTNALLLARHARGLREAGVGRVNISLDSLNPETFFTITRNGRLDTVLAGIDAAVAAGLGPVKVNMVVMRGINDSEITAMVDFAREKGVILRFIETMPVGEAGQEVVDRFMPAEEILQVVKEHAGSELIPVKISRGAGPARYYRISGSTAEVGVISALSQHFCEGCNRVRLTSQGSLVLCLGRVDSVDLKTPLRNGASDEEMKTRIQAAIDTKPMGHQFDAETPKSGSNHRMSALGG